MSHRSVIILPEDSIQPFLTAIANARNSLLIKMFIFSDHRLLAGLIAAGKRGVDVKVMLNPSRSNGDVLAWCLPSW